MTSLAREANSAGRSPPISLSAQEMKVAGTVRHAATVVLSTEAAPRCGRSPETNSAASSAEYPRLRTYALNTSVSNSDVSPSTRMVSTSPSATLPASNSYMSSPTSDMVASRYTNLFTDG